MSKTFMNITNTILTISIVLLAAYLMFSPVIMEAQLYFAQLYQEEMTDSPSVFQSKYIDPQLIQRDLSDVPDQDNTILVPELDQPTINPSISPLPLNILNPTTKPVRKLPTPTNSPSFFARILEPFSTPATNTSNPQNTLQPPSISTTGGESSDIPLRNVLLIPKIGIDGLVHESSNPEILNYGIWRRPKTSTPDKGGNTVFVAHRYLYTTGINTFYHLPKMEINDQFVVFWQGKQYIYEVFEVKTVLPTKTEIEDNTDEAIVTLYTCTPLWTSEYRLVVKGKLINST